jgi:hypothetical protein
MSSQGGEWRGKIQRLGGGQGRNTTASGMIVRVLDSAKEHLVDGFQFYEVQASGLGTYFLDSLFADIDSLALYGGIHAHSFGFHRSIAKRFPFAIYYLLEGEEVKVHAVLDCRRRPSWIRRRLKRL